MKLQSDNKAELNSGHRGDLKAIVYRSVERGGGGGEALCPGQPFGGPDCTPTSTPFAY
jgi:hypothetical protein